MHAPARFQERGVQAVGYSLYAVLAALALTALVGQAAAQSTPTPTPTVLVYCTPPPCQEGEVFYCPGECAGGCGTECATPTPTATPTDTPTPCPTGTPPSCPVGEFVSCDPNPCNGCHCEPCTPCPPGEAFIGCPGLVCPCTCAPAQGSVAAGFSVGLPNSTVDVPIALLLEPGVELATLEFTLAVSSDGFEPLLSPISFQSAAALPTPNVIASIGNETVRLQWLAGFTAPLSGGLDLGVLNVPLPSSQGWGSYGLYTVNITNISATNADGSSLPLRGLGATITRCTMIFFGLVTDAATGGGINGASVCFNSGACVQTDPNGVYQELCYIGQSSGGTYLCATADGYEERCQGSWTPTGSSLEADFSLAAVTVPTPTLTNTPTATPGPEISITPSTLSLGCQGFFEITITNTGPPGTTLEITSITLANGYSEGFYGTGFSWDLSQITLPASLESGATLTIPVDFYATGQWAPSRLELTCDSNAANSPHLFVVYFGGSEDACNTPTSTPTTTIVIVDHPTPTETPPPTPTATFCPTDTPPPTGFATTPTPTATAILVSPCVGDCDNDGTVTIDEILTMVNMALGNAQVSDCNAGDVNGDGEVTIDEILTAVDNALTGCRVGTPTPTPSPTATYCPTGMPCPPQCRSVSDCNAAFELCLEPGGYLGCGVCLPDSQISLLGPRCTTDDDCDTQEGYVCKMLGPDAQTCVACSGPVSVCLPGCSGNDQCAADQVCEAHRCVAPPCGNSGDCPILHRCVPSGAADVGTCLRDSCSADSDCAGGVCVKGLCYLSFGQCVPMPA